MKFARALGLAVLLAMAAIPAAADSVTLFNTGVSSTGSLLPGGSVDPHYTVSGPGISGTISAVVFGSIPGSYVPNGPNSMWIAPTASGGAGLATGNYTYTTTFDLTGFNPATTVITGGWSTDNNGIMIILNGVVFNFTTSFTQFASGFSPFTLNSGFVNGVNTLQFVIFEGGVVQGLRVEMTGTADPLNPVPEPGTLVLVGSGIAGVWLRRRGRSKK